MRKIFYILLLPLLALSLNAKQDRPNILFIVSEDNGYNYMSFSGNKNASHPCIDKLASEGIVFSRAYSNGAVCAVARSTMITGMYASTLGTMHMRSLYPIPDFVDGYAKLFKEGGYNAYNAGKTDYNTSAPLAKHWDKGTGFNHPKGEPFIAVFNIMDSHESKIFPEAYAAFNKSAKKLRVGLEDVELAPYYVDTPQMRADIAFYHECVTNMDAAVGKIISQLEKDGTKDDTFIIYASDHGGVLPRSKRYLEDTGTHIPLVIVVPKNWQEYAIDSSDMLVSLVDIPPTMLSIAGIEIPDYMEGRAIMGKYKTSPSKYAYLYSGRYDSESYFCFRRAITDGTYRYIRDFLSFVPYAMNCEYPFRQAGATSWLDEYKNANTNELQSRYFESLGTADILYNTSEDEWEINNIYKEDTLKLKEMKAALYDIMLETKDAGILPEAFFYNMKNGECVYDLVRKVDFDYENVLNLAWKSGDRESADISLFEGNLVNPNSTKRYWAIVGLANLASKAEKSLPKLEELLEKDAEVANRIAAALAIHSIGGKEDIKSYLAGIDDDYIKAVEPSASKAKVAFLKGNAEGASAIVTNRMPFIGSMMYLDKFGLSNTFVVKSPRPEARKIKAKLKKQAGN